MKKHDFRGKRVLITGASTGIGRAMAEEFAKKGANLLLSALPAEEDILKELTEKLKTTYNIDTWAFAVDLSDPDGPDKLHKFAVSAVGDIYALVNNAGTVAYGKSWEIPFEPQGRTLTVNFFVPFRLMYLFLPEMVKRGSGVICNTSSVSALQPTPYHTVYGATKAALQSLSQGIRVELKGTGVSVCTVNPPYIDTDLLKVEGFPKEVRWYKLGGGLKTPEWVAKRAIRAFERDKFLYVPGLWAKFIHLGLIRFSPRRLVDLLSYYTLQGKKGKGVF